MVNLASIALAGLGFAFACLAWDARRLRTVPDDAPYTIEASARDESLEGVSLQEQSLRKQWHSRYGFGGTADVVWVWLILAVLCALGAGLCA